MGASVDTLVDELRDAARALDAAVWAAGLQGRFSSTRRSRSEQQRLYRAFVSGRHPFPVAAPGFSAHEYGEAFDYVVTPAEYQRDVGLTWGDWGGVWGGAADVVHFELPGASQRAEQRGREQLAQEQKPATVWEIGGVALSFTSVMSLLFELGYIVASEDEAISVMKVLHIPVKRR